MVEAKFTQWALSSDGLVTAAMALLTMTLCPVLSTRHVLHVSSRLCPTELHKESTVDLTVWMKKDRKVKKVVQAHTVAKFLA